MTCDELQNDTVWQDKLKIQGTKMLDVQIIPALKDNYIFLLRHNGKVAVIDPSTHTEVMSVLDAQDEKLDYIFNTHHHWDHVGGNSKLVDKFNCEVYGPKNQNNTIPCLTRSLTHGDKIEFTGRSIEILGAPGHTLDHIMYWFKDDDILFCGDVLFSLGCGRIFEGTFEQMWHSLEQIKSLPKQTKIYCAHEYTLDNCKFALSLNPTDPKLKAKLNHLAELKKTNTPSIPALLSEELELNPFLNCSGIEEFTKRRELKNNF